jgi:hypothetical protein
LNNISCSSFKNTKLSNHELSDLGGDIDGDLGDTLSQLFLRQVGLYQSSWLELDLVFACEIGGDIDGDLGGDIDGDLGGDIDGDLGGIWSQLFLRQVGLYQSSWLELDLVFACEMGGDIDGVLAGEIGLEEDDDQLGLRPSNEIGL